MLQIFIALLYKFNIQRKNKSNNLFINITSTPTTLIQLNRTKKFEIIY